MTAFRILERKYWLPFLAVLVLAVLVYYGLWQRRRVEETTVPEPTAEAEAAQSQGRQTSARNEPVAENAPTQPPRPGPPASPGAQASTPPATVPADINAAAPLPGSKAEHIREVLSNYNNEPIVFYGKLEDQFGSPVADAVVDFSVRIINGVQSTTERGQVASDAGGLFTISGHKGQDLNITPKRPGYAIASTNRFANYSRLFPEDERAHPDPNNPIVIKMWKLQGAEPLAQLDHKYKIPYSAAPIYFDLLAGKIVPAGGDLKITISRASGVMSGANRLDWSVRIDAVDGGLMDSAGSEATTYQAPAEGYQPSVRISFSTNAWSAGFNRGLFVMSRGGQVYSKLGLTFTINQKPEDPMYIAFGGVASTNGSRNWEGDPNTFKPK